MVTTSHATGLEKNLLKNERWGGGGRIYLFKKGKVLALLDGVTKCFDVFLMQNP